MLIRGEDLRCKDVINLKDGVKIGTVDDLELDSCTAQIQAIVIGGRKRFFGLLGQEEDIVISWKDINVIGEDAILVCLEQCGCCHPKRNKGQFFRNLFG